MPASCVTTAGMAPCQQSPVRARCAPLPAPARPLRQLPKLWEVKAQEAGPHTAGEGAGEQDHLYSQPARGIGLITRS